MTVTIVHLGQPGYRVACGILRVKAQSTHTGGVTCLKCATTLKYERALEREKKS
jgi:hypothetical protein